MVSLPLSALLEHISPALPKKVPIFLVGGAVRDALLNRASHDLDFIVQGNARKAARTVANALGAAYYPLNDVFDAGRVLYTPQLDQGTDEEYRRYILDFTALRGTDLEDDLVERDFTVNAIALDISSNHIIDPLSGGQDLREKIVRACSSRSFSADPIRILRAVRLANQLGFQIDPVSLGWLREALPRLRQTTVERLREEILCMCGGSNPERAFHILDTLNILPEILPEISRLKGIEQSPPHIYDVLKHTFTLVEKLTALLDLLSPDYSPDPEAGYSTNLIMGMAVTRLGRFRQNFAEHFSQKDYPEYSRRALLIFAALYHDAGKALEQSQDEDGRIRFNKHEQAGADLVSQRAHSFHMSNDDIAYLQTVVRNHMRPFLLNLRKQPPTRRAIYHFFRDSGSAGVDICLLALADYLATYVYTISQTAWAGFLDIVYTLLEKWWCQQEENISPPALIDGNDILTRFHLKPGPMIGVLLEFVRESQATGEISTREQAYLLVTRRLAEIDASDRSDNGSLQS
jgi:poly(A) polymerase